MTRQEALELFCKHNFYEDYKLDRESKEEFLIRKKSAWAINCVRMQLSINATPVIDEIDLSNIQL